MRPAILNTLENDVKLKPLDPDKSSSEKQKIKCLICSSIFSATPKSKIMNHKKYGSVGCPACNINVAYSDKREEVIKRIEDKGYVILSAYEGIKNSVKVLHRSCTVAHIWKALPSNLANCMGQCKICYNINSSATITGVTDKNYFSLLDKFVSNFDNIELNFKIKNYVSSFRYEKTAVLLVSFNQYREGIIKNKKYFIDMKNEYKKEGYRLIIIYENEFREKSEIIISKIKNITHQQRLPSIMARKCTIKEIDPEIKSKFLDQHHIQGKSPSNINLGAFFEDKLIAVMTFVKPRVLLGFKNKNYDGIFELARYVSDNNYLTPGMASKLLAYFKNNYNWKEIFSYADLRWSDGDIYFKLGFKLDSIVMQNYHYIINGKIKHRWGYRKDKLKELFVEKYDPSLTEYKNMINFGYDRVWDCGNLKFIMKNETIKTS